MILVTGATGTVGRPLVAQLLTAGEKVRALTRDPSSARMPDGVDVVAADLEQPQTLAPAVDGVDAVFSLALGPRLGIQEWHLARAARLAGVRKIVKLSVLGAGNGARNGVVGWHDAGERAIQDAGIPWTILRPGAFMSNALYWAEAIRKQGKVYSNFGDGKIPYIHPGDIAAAAAAVLTGNGQDGKAYSLTGPEPLSVRQQVKIIESVAGRSIEVVDIADEFARAQLEKSGMPVYLMDALMPFAAVVRQGKAETPLHPTQPLTGKPPLTFLDWARENTSAFV